MAKPKIFKEPDVYCRDISPLLSIKGSTTTKIKAAVETVRELAEDIKGVKTHQVRNIYKLIQDADNVTELNLIRPRLAYIGARQDARGGRKLVDVMDLLIVKVLDETQDGESLANLKYIMESIVAFHKFFAKD